MLATVHQKLIRVYLPDGGIIDFFREKTGAVKKSGKAYRIKKKTSHSVIDAYNFAVNALVEDNFNTK